MSSKNPSLAAVAVAAGSALTLGGFVVALALSRRVAESAQPSSLQPQTDEPRPVQSPPFGFSEDDVEAAARMLASENGLGSPQLWTELIGSQLHARKPGETLHERITAGSGYGQQGERLWPGRLRPVSTDQVPSPIHR